MYLGTTTGLFKSTDGGTTFSVSQAGFTGLNINSIFISKMNGYIFAGSYRSTDNGASWPENHGGGNTVNAFAVNSFNSIYCGGLCWCWPTWYQSAVGYTTDYGEVWGGNSIGLPATATVQALCINDLDYVIAGTDGHGIYRSIDNGNNWSQINLTNNFVYSLIADSLNMIYAGTGGGKIFRSTDAGLNWGQIYINTISNNVVKTLALTSNNIIYAGLDSGGVITSTNHGNTWVQSSFTTSHVNSIVFNSLGYIYIGTGKNGIYGSTNNGISWSQMNTGLTNTQIYSLAIDNNGFMYAGTNGSSIFKSVYSTISVRGISTEIPKSYNLYQNYPNPFNPVTKIRFDVPLKSDLKIEVIDITGRTVAVLFSGNLAPGTFETNWNASSKASGIYFVQLISGNFRDTKKMVLVK